MDNSYNYKFKLFYKNFCIYNKEYHSNIRNAVIVNCEQKELDALNKYGYKPKILILKDSILNLKDDDHIVDVVIMLNNSFCYNINYLRKVKYVLASTECDTKLRCILDEIKQYTTVLILEPKDLFNLELFIYWCSASYESQNIILSELLKEINNHIGLYQYRRQVWFNNIKSEVINNIIANSKLVIYPAILNIILDLLFRTTYFIIYKLI